MEGNTKMFMVVKYIKLKQKSEGHRELSNQVKSVGLLVCCFTIIYVTSKLNLGFYHIECAMKILIWSKILTYICHVFQNSSQSPPFSIE